MYSKVNTWIYYTAQVWKSTENEFLFFSLKKDIFRCVLIVFSIKNNKDFVRFSVTDFKTWHEIKLFYSPGTIALKRLNSCVNYYCFFSLSEKKRCQTIMSFLFCLCANDRRLKEFSINIMYLFLYYLMYYLMYLNLALL